MAKVNDILHSLREGILQSSRATKAAKIPISWYRKYIYYFGPDKKKIQLATGEELEFYTETEEEIRHFYPLYGELDNLNLLVKDFESDDIFYDIGSHIGVYACAAALRIDSSQIFAFEPAPKNVARSHDNADLNGVSFNTLEYALSNEEKTEEFAIDADEAGAVGHSDSSIRDFRIDVDFVPGVELVKRENLPKPTVLKVDIEGAELKALRGLEGALGQCRLIYCEVSESSERYGSSKDELLDWLRERGFDIEPIGGGGREHYDIRAVR